jgi:hypothetical protein
MLSSAVLAMRYQDIYPIERSFRETLHKFCIGILID